MLTSTSTADAAPGASIVAVDIAVLSLLSFLNDDDDEDEKGGPSQLDLALEKENNVITMHSSGWRSLEIRDGCHLMRLIDAET